MSTLRLIFDDGTVEEVSASRLPAAGVVAMERKFKGDVTTEAVLWGKWWGRAKIEAQAVGERGEFDDWLSTFDLEVLPDGADASPPSSAQPPGP